MPRAKSLTLSLKEKRSHLLNLPIILTLARIVISPIFFILYLYYEKFGVSLFALPYVLIGLLVLCEVSDFLDGYIARKMGVVTDLGKILDPMSDSIYRLSIMLAFTQGVIQIPLLLIFVFLYRDMMISTLRTVCALKGMALAARWSGKLKALLQAVVIFVILLLMIPYTYGLISLKTFQDVSFILVSIAAIYTFFSGIEYFYANWTYIKQLLSDRE